LKFIEGIPDRDLERWYASVMINRLMFIYFVQKKGFLDNDKDYLRAKLRLTKNFYKDFLCKIAFEQSNAGGISPVWNLLKENPDRYIYDAVKHGIELPLPAEIEKGVDTTKPNLLERHKEWNKPAPAEDAARHYQMFKDQQTKHGGLVTAEDKMALSDRFRQLEDKLNRYLAADYGVEVGKEHSGTAVPAVEDRATGRRPVPLSSEYQQWLKSHQPFHWFIEFYGIMHHDGFDVIIGNPPYVEYAKVKKDYKIRGYETEDCGNLYAYVIERCMDTLRYIGRMGMIVQLPIVCTDRMKSLQAECVGQSNNIWFATFDDRPARLFDGLEHIRAAIFSLQKGATDSHNIFSTTYNRWYSEARPQLFQVLSFSEITAYLMDGAIPKIGQATAISIRQGLAGFQTVGSVLSGTTCSTPVFFHNAPQYWIRAIDFVPYFWNEREGEQVSTQVKTLQMAAKTDASVMVAALNSSLFYWWFIILSDCRHLNMREIENFPLRLDRMPEEVKSSLADLTHNLMTDFKRHKERKECRYQATGKVIYDEFYPKHSKTIIDEIDRVLAQHYGFTEEELDFIINYDIKYRMGLNGEEAEE
jgi:hypothetical protein